MAGRDQMPDRASARGLAGAGLFDRAGALSQNDYSAPAAYGFRDVLVKGFVDEVVEHFFGYPAT